MSWLSNLQSAQEKYRDNLKRASQQEASLTSRDREGAGRSSSHISMTSFFETASNGGGYGLLQTPFTRGLTPPKRRYAATTNGNVDSDSLCTPTEQRSQSDVGLRTTTASELHLLTKPPPPQSVTSHASYDVRTVGMDNLGMSLRDSNYALDVTTNESAATRTARQSGTSAQDTSVLMRRVLSPPTTSLVNGRGPGQGPDHHHQPVPKVYLEACDELGGSGTTAGHVTGSPRPRPSSLHAKRRSMLKAIREKSLSIDMPAGSLTLSSTLKRAGE